MDPAKFLPLENRIVVLRSEEVEKERGLYIPAGAAEVPTEGVVVSVGPGLFTDGVLSPMRLRPGDAILFGKYAGNSFTHQDQTYLVMRETEVLGVIDRDLRVGAAHVAHDPFYDTDEQPLAHRGS